MKQLLFVLFLFCGLAAGAQAPAEGVRHNFEDSADNKIALRIPEGQLSLLIQMLPDKERPDVKELARQLVPYFKSYDSARVIMLDFTYSLVRYTYEVMGLQQERLTAENNAVLRGLIQDQVQGRPVLVQEITEMDKTNTADRQQLRELGVRYVRSLGQ